MPQQQKYLDPDIAPRLAAIDIGSNSIRLVVAEAQPDGRYRVLDEERETTRLGSALASTGRLEEGSIELSLAALRRFQSIASGLGVEQLKAIATCAVREAENGSEFCERVRQQLGLEVEVISAQEEAHLAMHSVRSRCDLVGKNIALVDIGGGSTEIVVASGQLIKSIYATSLGAVRLTDRFGGGQSLAGDDFRRMRRWIDRQLKRTTDKPTAPLHLLIGSGGTFTTLGTMAMASRGQSRLPVAGCQISRAELRHLIDRLRKMSLKARREVPGLSADRADIIVPGLTVIDRIMRRFDVNMAQVHPYGVRDGLLLSMIDSSGHHGEPLPPDDASRIDKFAEACGVEMDHARHAARLAKEIFLGLSQGYELELDDLRLLDAAARMQDVGYLISYKGHHKHSYHLILHSQLEGFRPEEIEIIANVARYHRGPEPKSKHVNFRQLDKRNQQRVRIMAAILRLAGGLDRSHDQAVESVEVRVAEDEIELIVSSQTYPEVNLWSARRRAGLFQKVFDAEPIFQWAKDTTLVEQKS